MLNKIETHVLKLSCKDQVGIVSKISTLLANFKCNIVESKQFTDQQLLTCKWVEADTRLANC